MSSTEDSTLPLVTIRCLVYNHEPFLRDCLEGFVMQQTDFPFEAIVHDDASTDHSADIIREYAEKYPHIIKPIYEKENLYSKKDGSLGKVMNEAASPSSKYVAYCEGDDYWTDPTKLQKQVDFMEANPEYSMCFHRALLKWEDGSKDDSIYSSPSPYDRDYSGAEIFQHARVHTATLVMKKSILLSEIYKETRLQLEKYPNGDTILFLTCASMGKVRGLADIMSVYRKHAGGISYQWRSSQEARLRNIKFARDVAKVFGPSYCTAVKDMCTSWYKEGTLHALVNAQWGHLIRFTYKYFTDMPLSFLIFVLSDLRKHIVNKLSVSTQAKPM